MSSVVASARDLSEVCAFLVLFFGIPCETRLFSDRSASLGRLLFFYEGFALSLDAVFSSGAAAAPPGVALTGSLSCAAALVEFRFGAERLSAYAPSEDLRYRLAFPEGDGERYRKMDEASPSGPVVADGKRDAEAVAFAERLLGSVFDSFGARP